MPASCAVWAINATASSNGPATSGSPGNRAPTDRARSDGPTYTPSRPGVAQISATFFNPSGVSIIASTTVAASASAGTGPTRSADRIGPYDRTPAGGYFAACTARVTSSELSTSGTITPAAPASSARPIGVGWFASTRTRPTDPLPSAAPASTASNPVSRP